MTGGDTGRSLSTPAGISPGGHASPSKRGDAAPRLSLRLGLNMIRGLSVDEAARIAAARPFASVDDAWRRADVSPAALERIAEADGFRGLGLDRRQALWQVRGLGARPLPLFAAADARAGRYRAEANEPAVPLTPMTEGREVVEDYRATQLSLRAHPLHFLREDLARRRILPAAALARVPDGRKVEVAGIILVRQKPGSAKGVLFLTIEDETGIANGILWPDRFEAQRVTVMSAAMIGMQGRVQREGPVIHVICDRIMDYTDMLRQIGRMDFPHRPGPGDGATHGGAPDRGDAGWQPKGRDSLHKPFRTGLDPEDAVLRQKSRDFH